MQEKIDVPSITRHQTTNEERRSHIETWKKSGLSMSEYCRRNNLPLSKVSEWKRGLLKKSKLFRAVNIASPPSETMIKSTNVIEIIIEQRIKIRLQQVTDASLVISIAKGLMVCS